MLTGKYEGAVELLYGEEGTGMGREYFAPLMNINLASAVLTDKQKAYLLRCIPERLGPWVDAEGNERGYNQAYPESVKVLVEDKELDFEEDIWKPYDFKMHKERAILWWGKQTKPEQALASARIYPYLRYLSRTGIGKAELYNWLKKKYFNNDYDNL